MAGVVMVMIDEGVKKSKILLYMKGAPDSPQRRFFAHTGDILKCYGFPFDSEDVLADPQIRDGVKRYSNWPTIPQVFINGKFVGGCDILHQMHEKGELEPMLKATFE